MSDRAPGAFLALWNGVNDPAVQAEYETWHAFEHVPERVGSPGFVAARRFRATQATPGVPAYFTLYALEGTQALLSPRYQDLIDRPTAWSARMRGVLSDFCREPCETISSHGVSSASHLATLRVRAATGEIADAVTAALETLVRSGHALHACWGRVDLRSGHPLSTDYRTDHRSKNAPDAAFDAVILLQHLREDLLHAAVRQLQSILGDALALRAPAAYYALQSAVRQADLVHSLDERQPPRPDLRQRFPTGDLSS